VAAVVGDAATRWSRAESQHRVLLDGLAPTPLLLAFQERLAQQRQARPDLPEHAWYLSSLGVDPGFRRRGLARMLLGRATQLAHERGCDRVLVEVVSRNTPAVTLYEGAGYGEAGRWRPPGGPLVLRLEKRV